MSNVTINRDFKGRIAELERAAEIIQTALKSDAHGPAVVSRMTPTFPDDFDALVTALVTAIKAQADAKGTVHTGTQTQGKTLAETALYVGTARDIAKKAFKANKPVQHDEFMVGQHTPHAIDAIIVRAEKVHASCVKYAEAMAGKGWPAADTAKLAELITTLKTANTVRVGSGGVQKGSTTGLTNLANAVYEQIRLVQIAANIAYPEAEAASDNNIVESRSQYLLGVYPPRANATDEQTDPPAPAAGGSPAVTSPPAPAGSGS